MEKIKMDQQAISLELENVTKTFSQRDRKGLVRAVDDVSLTIYKGEFLTLLGPSGCGKTTTLRLIAGFEMPDEGKILLEGQDITHDAPNKRDMAMVFQSYALFPHMSVFDNIAYGLQIRRLGREEIENAVDGALEQVGLTGLAKRRPNELSGGQQQRVALARSLIMEPSVLLFDEPLSNLDAKLRVQMRSEIRGLQRRLNITSVYVTHDQIEAMALSDRVVVMNNGEIEQIGTPEDIYRYPKSRFVADFIGRANFVETQAEAIEGNKVTVTLLGKTMAVAMESLPRVGDKLMAVLRPESLSVQDAAELKQVRVDQAMYLGSQTEYVVDADGQQVIVEEVDPRAGLAFTEGQVVGINFTPEAVHLLPTP
jgi:iron(III) transport system ATP-binding protein